MPNPKLSVREIETADINLLLDYWYTADAAYLHAMGADITKLPPRDQFEQTLYAQIVAEYPNKAAYAIIWLMDNVPIGHSNINKIQFGEEAFMHIHIWNAQDRRSGHGLTFLKLSLPFYFRNFQLKRLFCEPYALNPAPNALLAQAGFSLKDSYTCIPGWLNFEQKVNLWSLEQS